MTTATFSNPRYRPPVVGLRLGRLCGVVVVGVGLLVAGGYWLLKSFGTPLVTAPVDAQAPPSWLKHPPAYAVAEPVTPPVAAPVPDKTAEIMRTLAAMQRQMEEQAAALDALKRRSTTVVQQQQAQAAKPTPAKPPRTEMLFVSHELKDAPPSPKAHEYTLAAWATHLPCTIEPLMNSDVPGAFTAKVHTNIYDTKTGQHLLVPQGATIGGVDSGETLLYGNERLPTVALALTIEDRTYDLGKSPVTDQLGTNGLTGEVNQHFWRNVGAVFIGGALRGGTQALQTSLADAGGVGQVAAGIGSLGNQAVSRQVGRALDTRPTIKVFSGQGCNVLLTKALTLPAVWQ